MEGSTHDWKKTIGKQRFKSNKASPNAYLKFPPMNCISILFYFMFYLSFNYQNLITIWIRLTEIYKMTIACFKPTISVGSTLTHVRYYLDDLVHLLVSCAEMWKVWITISHTNSRSPPHSLVKMRHARERYPHPYKACFVPLSNRCGPYTIQFRQARMRRKQYLRSKRSANFASTSS